ncbi:protein of unknown function [Streptococcus thermophilus]|uniref:Uncharacterized protein n=1 Tax=Streptococcus thermophilus TaxID=1308 RepID=A0A8D6XPW9_STRTR|nr:protein of unknown function [Streptococcus thermophilus]
MPHCVSTTTRMAANLGFKTSLILFQMQRPVLSYPI